MWTQSVLWMGGSSSHFLWRLAPGLLLLALLGSTAVLISLAMRARKQLKKHTSTLPAPRLVTGQTVTTVQDIRRISIAVLLTASISGPGGWFWRDHQFTANRYHYTEVRVIRHDPSNYTLQPARMTPFDATTCTPQNWQTGEKMKSLHFQWTPDCDHVDQRGDFEFYTHAGKRVLFPEEELTNVEYRPDRPDRPDYRTEAKR